MGVKIGGLIPVAHDEIATVVTSLAMTQRPALRPLPASPLRLTRWERPTPERYRALFRRIGTPWLWYSRLAIDDAALAKIVEDPRVAVFAVVDRAGIEVGMVELDFREGSACDIAYFGMVPELTGRGHGRWLMAETLARAWVKGVTRVRVNTCTLDHPSALGFYRAQGFVAIARTLETFPDPRLLGLLSPEAAPHVPMIG